MSSDEHRMFPDEPGKDASNPLGNPSAFYAFFAVAPLLHSMRFLQFRECQAEQLSKEVCPLRAKILDLDSSPFGVLCMFCGQFGERFFGWTGRSYWIRNAAFGFRDSLGSRPSGFGLFRSVPAAPGWEICRLYAQPEQALAGLDGEPVGHSRQVEGRAGQVTGSLGAMAQRFRTVYLARPRSS
jgi:hypothetical protein